MPQRKSVFLKILASFLSILVKATWDGVEEFLLAKNRLEHGMEFFNHAKNSCKKLHQNCREVFFCFVVTFFNLTATKCLNSHAKFSSNKVIIWLIFNPGFKSVVKHEKRVGGSTRRSRVFLFTSRVSYRFLSALQQNRAQSGLLYLFCDKDSINFPTNSAYLQLKLYFPHDEK